MANTLLAKRQRLEDEGKRRRAIFKEERKQRLANLDAWLATLREAALAREAQFTEKDEVVWDTEVKLVAKMVLLCSLGVSEE